MVHSKLMIVDDDFLTVGSANLNRRSMSVDTEANLAIEADTAPDRQTIASLRDRLLGEHLGIEPEAVPDAIRAAGSLGDIIADRATRYRGGSGEGRTLLPIDEPASFDLDPATNVLLGLADPDRRMNSGVLNAFTAASAPTYRPRLQKLAIAAAIVVVAILGILWTITPLADFTDVSRLGPLFERIQGTSWTPVLVAVIYTVASLVMFPITVLLVLTAMTFAPVTAGIYAVLGTTLGAFVTYALGRWGGRRLVHRLMGHRLKSLSARLSKHGILTIVALRITPVAPFTLINLAAGATHIRTWDFVVGTALGLLPSVVALTAVGESLWQVIEEPTAGRLTILGAVIAGWIALCIGLQRLMNRFGTSDKD